MKNKRNTIRRTGAALLVVLFIVMAITTLSLGFLSRSDTELSCGNNMLLRAQMDCMAESGLEHAKGLILNPQDIGSQFWSGAVSQQLSTGSDDYYDVSVTQLGQLNYQIECDAYRQRGGEQIGRSSLTAELRLDPCIAYWQGHKQTIPPEVIINGDVYCDDDFSLLGIVNGDVFAAGSINGSSNVLGQSNSLTSSPVTWPGLVVSQFSSEYYIGSTQYSVTNVGIDEINDITFAPTVNNPAGILYHNGDLKLSGVINITGMLVVNGDLRIEVDCDVTITAVKNFPALLVGNDLVIQNDNQSVSINGLAQINNCIDMKGRENARIDVSGALFILGDGIKNLDSSSQINISAAPNKAALELWPNPGTAQRWTPAAGAFFKSIKRR